MHAALSSIFTTHIPFIAAHRPIHNNNRIAHTIPQSNLTPRLLPATFPPLPPLHTATNNPLSNHTQTNKQTNKPRRAPRPVPALPFQTPIPSSTGSFVNYFCPCLAPRLCTLVVSSSHHHHDLLIAPLLTMSVRTSTLHRTSFRAIIPLIALCFLTLLLYNHPAHRHDVPQFSASVRTAVRKTAFVVPNTRPKMAVVTSINYAFRHYLLNMACSMRRVGLNIRLLVVSMDEQTHRFALQHGFDSVFMPGMADEHEHVFGSSTFNLLSKQKLLAVYHVLNTATDVLFVDADIVWCTDIAADIARTMYHQPASWRDGLGDGMPHFLMQTAWPRSLLNSGLYYVRSTAHSIRAFEHILRQDSENENDQVVVNRVLCRPPNGQFVYNGSYAHPRAPHRRMPALCRWNNVVEARLLDANRFPTGGEYVHDMKLFHHPRETIMQMCSSKSVAAIHNNCILSGKKKARFIVKGLWYVDNDGQCVDPVPATRKAKRTCGRAKCGDDAIVQ